jgi:hypothetical protein
VGVAPENNWVVDMTVAVAVGWEIDTGYPSGKRILTIETNYMLSARPAITVKIIAIIPITIQEMALHHAHFFALSDAALAPK